MFAIHLRRLYRTCDKTIVRNVRRGKNIPGPNPGLDSRIKAFQQDGFKITDDDAEEFIDQSETDFYKVGEAYNEHMNETLIGKYELRHRIIKEKYFKENMPNLVTWSEKEQIRHLANTEPDEWTPEKIAESFPITVAVVKKLLKYPWKPATEQRIARHDASVMRNWKELKEGSLDIPKDLVEHFLKFSDRTIPPLNTKSVKIDITQKEDIGEFERIVQRCAAKEKSNTDDNNVKSNKYTNNGQENETKKAANKKAANKDFNRRVTLDQLSTKIKQRIDDGQEVDIPDKIIINTINDKSIEATKDISKEFELLNDNEAKELTKFNEKDDAVTNVMDYPERIRIPKKAHKKGATYKVNDCYYDHDGRFLYRVLGMN